MVDRLERRRFLGGGPLYNPQPKVPTSFTKPTVHFPFLSLGNFVFCFVLLVVDLGIFATHPDSPAPFSLRNYSLARRPIIVSSISCSEVTNFPRFCRSIHIFVGEIFCLATWFQCGGAWNECFNCRTLFFQN